MRSVRSWTIRNLILMLIMMNAIPGNANNDNKIVRDVVFAI